MLSALGIAIMLSLLISAVAIQPQARRYVPVRSSMTILRASGTCSQRRPLLRSIVGAVIVGASSGPSVVHADMLSLEALETRFEDASYEVDKAVLKAEKKINKEAKKLDQEVQRNVKKVEKQLPPEVKRNAKKLDREVQTRSKEAKQKVEEASRAIDKEKAKYSYQQPTAAGQQRKDPQLASSRVDAARSSSSRPVSSGRDSSSNFGVDTSKVNSRR